MPIPNEERDKRFRKDVAKGLSIVQLAKKYRLSLRQVSRLKKKLREKEAARKPEKQITRKPESQKE